MHLGTLRREADAVKVAIKRLNAGAAPDAQVCLLNFITGMKNQRIAPASTLQWPAC